MEGQEVGTERTVYTYIHSVGTEHTGIKRTTPTCTSVICPAMHPNALAQILYIHNTCRNTKFNAKACITKNSDRNSGGAGGSCELWHLLLCFVIVVWGVQSKMFHSKVDWPV